MKKIDYDAKWYEMDEVYIFWYLYDDGLYHKTRRQPHGHFQYPEDDDDQEQALCGKVNDIVMDGEFDSDLPPEKACKSCSSVLLMMELAQ